VGHFAGIAVVLLTLLLFQGATEAEPTTKTDYEKLMDQRRLQSISGLWTLYWNRNKSDMSLAEQKRVTALMNKVKYPNLQYETTPSAQISKVIQGSINDLGHELEKELAAAPSFDGAAGRVRQNVEYLHDTPEVVRYQGLSGSGAVGGH
jgi:hypothetical protein